MADRTGNTCQAPSTHDTQKTQLSYITEVRVELLLPLTVGETEAQRSFHIPTYRAVPASLKCLEALTTPPSPIYAST